MKSLVRLVVTMTVLALAPVVAAAQQKPARLVVTNNTGTTVELFTRVGDDWQSRGRISPGAAVPVYNVANGQRFRAVWGSRSRELVIKLEYDRKYGGWQQEWELPGKDDRSEPPGASAEAAGAQR